MSYGSRNYNTRNSTGRYNTPGQFVPATEKTEDHYSLYGNNLAQNQNQSNFAQIQQEDVEMKPSMPERKPQLSSAGDDDSNSTPHWMKSKLQGVKKISNRERRRRQNATLRRLLSPKNALMVLNEMLPGENIANQFKVSSGGAAAGGYYARAAPGFSAELTHDGYTYRGFGDTKVTARNAAAEQVIRDIIIKRMGKALSAEGAAGAGGAGAGEGGAAAAAAAAVQAAGEAEGEGDSEESLPMLQLASFALHKLFAEWEYEGHKVPQMRAAGAGAGAGAGEDGAGGEAALAQAVVKPRAPRAPRSNKPRELPQNAANLHPCILLTYMRPQLEYRSLGQEGERPPHVVFSAGVDVDGATYLGKGSSKKEARRQAAMAACRSLFGVTFADTPTDTTPVAAPAPPAAPVTA